MFFKKDRNLESWNLGSGSFIIRFIMSLAAPTIIFYLFSSFISTSALSNTSLNLNSFNKYYHNLSKLASLMLILRFPPLIVHQMLLVLLILLMVLFSLVVGLLHLLLLHQIHLLEFILYHLIKIITHLIPCLIHCLKLELPLHNLLVDICILLNPHTVIY